MYKCIIILLLKGANDSIKLTTQFDCALPALGASQPRGAASSNASIVGRAKMRRRPMVAKPPARALQAIELSRRIGLIDHECRKPSTLYNM